MSRLTRLLERSMRQIQGTRASIKDRVMEKIDDSVVISKIRDYYYSLQAFFSNLPMFIRFAWGFRGWDSRYSMEVYVSLLEVHGRKIRKYGHGINSEKRARRAFTIAGMLRKAYLEDIPNKTISYLYDKNGFSFMRNYAPKIPKRILDGMRNMAIDREDVEEARLKRDAMLYWYKHIESIWD